MPARSLPTLAAAGVAAILAAVALLTAASAAPATAPPRPSSSVSEHDNYIYFDSNTTITVTFTEQVRSGWLYQVPPSQLRAPPRMDDGRRMAALRQFND